MILPTWLQKICGGAANGVTLFFVVSALSLTLSARSRQTLNVTQYALRRYLRIAPMFYMAAIFYMLIEGTGPNMWAPNGYGSTEIIETFALTHIWFANAMNSVVPGGWSIGVEVTFYVCLPFLLFIAAKNRLALAAIALIVLVVSQLHFVIATHWTKGNWQPVFWFSFLNQVPIFFAGIFAAILIQDDSYNRFLGPLYRKSVAVIILILMLIVLPQITRGEKILEGQFRFALFAMLLCVILHKIKCGIISNKFIAFLGKISFSLYLIHFVFLGPSFYFASLISKYHGVEFLIIFYVSTMTISSICAAITYRFIELPFMTLSRAIRLPKLLTVPVRVCVA